MFNDLPGWVIPLVSSVFTGIGTLLAAVLSYKHQSKKIAIEYTESSIRLKEVDLNEIKAIAEGNKALREALIERVNSYEITFKNNEEALQKMSKAHKECESRLADAEELLRSLKRRIKSLEAASAEIIEKVNYDFQENTSD